MRLKLEIVLWSLGFLLPIAVSTVLPGSVYFSVLQPALPFICLALICRFLPKIRLTVITGAAIPAVVVLLGVYGWGLHDALHKTYAGANFALGLLLVFMPVYLVPLMFIGGLVGRRLGHEG